MVHAAARSPIGACSERTPDSPAPRLTRSYPGIRAERRRDYLAAGDSALGDYQRTGIAYAMEDVERYIVALAEGRQAAKPRPSKRSKKG
jgi:hypothetical protein